MELNGFGIAGVACITVICYLAVLGPVCMLVVPDFPAGDPVTAVAVGIVSGLAATGADQVVKQLKKAE